MKAKLIKIFCIIFFFIGLLIASSNIIIKGNAETPKNIADPISNSTSIFSILANTPERLSSGKQKIVYGYLPYWSLNDSKYLQMDKLTDISYFGLNINKDGSFRKVLDDGTYEQGYLNWYENQIVTETIKKAKANNVRFSITVISHIDEISTAFLNCESCWAVLRDNLFNEMDKHGIKDLNLNFEYVELVDPAMAKKYTKFTDFMNKEMDKRYGESYVVVATFADSLTKPRISDIAGLSKAADGIFIMAYDFHRPTSDTAGPVAPIDGIGVHAEYDIRTMINDYLKVADPKKLILGVPYYGYNWVVEDQSKYAKRITGNEDIGFSTSQTYAAIMDNVIDLSPALYWDELGKNPYFSYISPATGSLRTVHFDNKESLKIKYDLVKEKGLGGTGIWALGYDKGYTELWGLLKSEFFSE